MNSSPWHTRFVLALGLFVALAAFCVPHAAYADVTDECGDDNQTDKALQAQSAETAQEIMVVSDYVIKTFGAIDITAQHCLDRLMDFYNTLMDLDLNVIDPIKLAVRIIFRTIVDQFLNALCSKILSTVQSLQNFLLSQLNRLCIPLPNLTISLGEMRSFNNASCDGIPALTVSPAPDYQQWDKYKPDDMIKTK